MLPTLKATPAMAAHVSRKYGAETLAGAINTLAWDDTLFAFRYLLDLAGPVMVRD